MKNKSFDARITNTTSTSSQSTRILRSTTSSAMKAVPLAPKPTRTIKTEVARPPSVTPSLTSSESSDEEMALLFDECTLDDTIEGHEVRTAPLFTREAYLASGVVEEGSQYGVLGRVLSVNPVSKSQAAQDPRLYLNTNAPFSALVCGVQGSGKSHTVSVMLESMMISGYSAIGLCEQPLSGLVLHFGEGGEGALPCEAAWLGCAKTDDDFKPPSVRVYVSKSSFSTMKKAYASLSNADIEVLPLTFSHSELDAQAILSMMAVGSSDSAPLYMQSVLSILRELGENFTYRAFLNDIKEAQRDMNPAQKNSLEQRLSLLASFVDPVRSRQESLFKPGRLTIIDLSDPFIDPAGACSLFEIVTRLFVRASTGTGKVLVVDEAHKYLSAHRNETGLTKALTSLIRQQRHLAMRVVISTQEPTAVPSVLIDLCSIAVFHRFSSPAWWDAVAKRVCADLSNDQGFNQVVKLKTGQALVLCPSGLGLFSTPRKTATGGVVQGKPTVAHFGRRHLLIKTRKRVTLDGGESRLAVSN